LTLLEIGLIWKPSNSETKKEMIMLDIKNMPVDVDLLPKKYRDFAIVLAQDGLIDDWSEVFDALNECDMWRDELERLQ
jgi:hypothetical protein